MLDFRILGPLEVTDGSGPVQLAGRNQRAVLTYLLVRANELVSSERLVNELWGEDAPRTATTSVHNAVSQLRKLLGAGVLHTRAGGYVLELDATQLDAARFERLVRDARTASAAERAALLRDALALWRGAPLADVELEGFAQPEIRRLEDLRLAAIEERVEADLELGRHSELVGELERLATEHPLRERLRAQLMLALYRSGRQAEALAAYHDGRRRLVEELGIEPGPELQALYSAILRQERSLTPAAPVTLDDHFDEVMRAAQVGRLVVFLGAGAAAAPAGLELASLLAERFQCPPEARGLAAVAQYAEARHGAGPLRDEILDMLAHASEPTAIQKWVASLPLLHRAAGLAQPLVVTTTLDPGIERAFEDAGTAFDVVGYEANGHDRGRFVHVPAAGDPTVIDEPNAYGGFTFDERPVLLRVHGGGARAETAAVREDDFIDYLTTGPAAVPVTLVARLRRCHLLFLGYEVEDWTLRVFLRRIFGADRFAYRSWAVGTTAPQYAYDLWRERGVDVYDAPLDDYAAELASRSAELATLVEGS